MPYLVAATTLALLIGLFNMVLMFGVIRRLRGHTELLSAQASAASENLMLSPGSRVPEFTVTTIAGRTVSRDTLGETLVGFFTPGCTACAERLPRFVELSRTFAERGVAVLAVVSGSESEADEYTRALEPVAQVVTEPVDGGPLTQAFEVVGYPTFGLISASHEVVAASFDPERLPVPTVA